MAWPESLLPLESDGESELDESELDELELDAESSVVELLDELVLELLEVLVLLELPEEAACAATPTASVPARLAATSAPVIAVVRLRPVSRSMIIPLSSLMTQRTVPHPLGRSLCRPCAPPVNRSPLIRRRGIGFLENDPSAAREGPFQGK